MPDRNTIHREKEQIAAMQCRLAGEAPGQPPFTVGDLRHLWLDRARAFWRVDVRIYDAFAGELVALGENFLALEVVEEGLTWDPGRSKLLNLGALACARAGALTRARDFLAKLEQQADQENSENVSLRARIWKDLMVLATEPERTSCRRLALDLYLRAESIAEEAGRHRQAAFPGVNAATLYLLGGEEERARKQTARIRRALANGKPAPGNEVWDAVTIAECSLIEGHLLQALKEYREANALGPVKRGNLGATYRQARLLMEHLGHDPAQLRESFPLPQIIIFAGHMIDYKRSEPRFPTEAEPGVAAALAEFLQPLAQPIAYSSAACGADILFLEAMQKLREDRHAVETHIVLPFDRETFCDLSVVRHHDAHDAGKWRARYEQVLDNATSITELAAGIWGGLSQRQGIPFGYGNSVLFGTAFMKSKEFHAELRALCVWDGRTGDGPGGTADCVASWQRHGVPIEIVSPAGGARRQIDLTSASGSSIESDDRESSEAIAFFVAGRFTAVTDVAEQEALTQRTSFFRDLSEILRGHESAVRERTVFDDFFQIVFDDARLAAVTALALSGLRSRYSRQMGIGLGVHAGPVLRQFNAATGEVQHIGRHSSKAIFLCQLSDGGPLYASREFAAFLALTPREDLRCEYLGIAPLGGEYGSEPLFQLVPQQAG
jgi:tetratricopeptide (TPR) repeat protein